MVEHDSSRRITSEYLDSASPDDRIEALNHARIRELDLHMDSRLARMIETLMHELSGGQENVRAIVDPQFRRSSCGRVRVNVWSRNAKLVKYLFFQLYKWYSTVPMEDLPTGFYPNAIFVLQTYLTGLLPLRLRDVDMCQQIEFRKRCMIRNDPGLEARSFNTPAELSAHRRELLALLRDAEGRRDLAIEFVCAIDDTEAGLESSPGDPVKEYGGIATLAGADPDEHDWVDIEPWQDLESRAELWKSWFDMRYRLSQLLLDPSVDRPEEAFAVLEVLAWELEGKHGNWQNVVEHNLRFVLHWIDARVLAGHFDLLTNAMTVMASNRLFIDRRTHEPFKVDALNLRLMVHIPLVQVHWGTPETKESWESGAELALLGSYDKLSESALRQILARRDQPPHPVYERMGGDDWMAARRASAMYKRPRCCEGCGVYAPKRGWKTCSGCRRDRYCSEACQKSHWPLHKLLCHEDYDIKLTQRCLKKAGKPYAAKQLALWNMWHRLTHYTVLWHALALHRHPYRGRTHILIREVEYAHDAPELRYRFTTKKCGVFETERALGDIERIMGCEEGNVRRTLETFNVAAQERAAVVDIPFFTFSYGPGLDPFLDAAMISRKFIQDKPYDPLWRNLVNRLGDEPPAPLVLPSGIPDVEHLW